MKKTEEKSRPGKLVGGAAVLAVGSIIAKLIGAFYRVPLTNILGAEGMGIYQLVFPVYALFMTLSTAGIPTALSRIVAEHRARGEGAKKYLAAALLTLVALSALAGILVTALSRVLAEWQGNPAAAGGYVAIAPAIFFVGVIAGLRGWFQGEMYMLPTALSTSWSRRSNSASASVLPWRLRRGVWRRRCSARLRASRFRKLPPRCISS